MRVALDTNVLVYLIGTGTAKDDIAKAATASATLGALQGKVAIVVATQVLGELFNVLRRSDVPADRIRGYVLRYAEALDVVGVDPSTMTAALDLAVDHRLRIWDALILTASAKAGSTLFLSEDLQDGFVTQGMTVVNPFASSLNPKLAALLA